MPLTFRHKRLANGLDIIAEPNPDSYSFAAGFFVNTGSRDEDASISGVSHFLEHMLFKGSDRYSWEDVNRIFDEMGARYNAFTSQEMTAYYANVIPEFTKPTIEHLAHLLRPALREEDFITEKKVILEEIAMYMDEPGQRLYEKLMETHFGTHTLSQSVLGTPESITALQREKMVRYFGERYGPGNLVVAVTGVMDFDYVTDLIEQYCGHWPHVDTHREYVAPVYQSTRRAIQDAKLNRRYVMGMTPGPSAQDEARFAARVLADVIGDSDGSRFYWALVDNALAEEADFGFYPHDRCGSFYLALTSDPEKSEQVLDIAQSELRRVRRDLNSEEVERAKNKIASGLILGGEVPAGRMRGIASQWLYNGDYRSLEEDLTTLLAITPKTLSDLMDAYLFDPMTIVSLGPNE